MTAGSQRDKRMSPTWATVEQLDPLTVRPSSGGSLPVRWANPDLTLTVGDVVAIRDTGYGLEVMHRTQQVT